jgi:TatD DNase family protein
MFDFLVDSHCHLDLLEDKGFQISEILENCHINKVNILQTICTNISDIDRLLKFCKLDDRIYSSYGIHPCNVSSSPKVIANDIVKMCNNYHKIIGIGETGLDYYHDKSFIDLQKEIFLEHLKASRITGLPLIIHSRNADSDMIKILTDEMKIGIFPALLHCFSSSYDLAKAAIDLGIYISIAGIASFKNAKELQDIIKKIPLEYLLVETDSPYLAPVPHRGKVNQPAYTIHVAQAIADIKGVSLSNVINQTTLNFLKIFTRVKI